MRSYRYKENVQYARSKYYISVLIIIVVSILLNIVLKIIYFEMIMLQICSCSFIALCLNFILWCDQNTVYSVTLPCMFISFAIFSRDLGCWLHAITLDLPQKLLHTHSFQHKR